MEDNFRRALADIAAGAAAFVAGAAAWFDLVQHAAQFISVVGGAALVLWRGYEWTRPRLPRRWMRGEDP